jgi:hypothetical protein
MLHGTMLHGWAWLKKGARFYDFVDSEVQCLFCKNRSAENTQIPSPWRFFMDRLYEFN